MDSRPKVIMDFDDLCDAYDPFNMLCTLKENDPEFKVTLFTIPMRCSKQLLKKYDKEKEWIELAMHGWWHTYGETLSWTKEEALDKMRISMDMGIDGKGFKAAKWVIDPIVYEAAKELGWYVADHKTNRYRIPSEGERIYISDLRLRDGKERRLHGHTRNVCDNGIEEAFPLFMLPRGKFEYRFISEVV